MKSKKMNVWKEHVSYKEVTKGRTTKRVADKHSFEYVTIELPLEYFNPDGGLNMLGWNYLRANKMLIMPDSLSASLID